MEGKKKSIVVDLQGAELEAWLTYRNNMTGTKVSPQDTSGRRVVSFAFFSKGHISFSTPEPRPRSPFCCWKDLRPNLT